jgi:hypothetical protein
MARKSAVSEGHILLNMCLKTYQIMRSLSLLFTVHCKYFVRLEVLRTDCTTTVITFSLWALCFRV